MLLLTLVYSWMQSWSCLSSKWDCNQSEMKETRISLSSLCLINFQHMPSNFYLCKRDWLCDCCQFYCLIGTRLNSRFGLGITFTLNSFKMAILLLILNYLISIEVIYDNRSDTSLVKEVTFWLWTTKTRSFTPDVILFFLKFK